MIDIICKKCSIEFEAKTRVTKYCVQCGKEIRRERCREYKRKNKQKISEYNAKYKSDNKEKISEYNARYNSENREAIQKRQTEQHKVRRKTDMGYKMTICLKNRLSRFYKGEQASIKDLIGCPMEFLLKWFEYNFSEDMCWENHGVVWQIDHVIMCSLFDLNSYEERKKCFNWMNLRPLKSSINMSRKKIDVFDLTKHELKIKSYNEENKIFGQMATKFLEKSKNG
jgi:hypothetical protein